MIYNKNAINWEKGETVASFINPKDKIIEYFTQDALSLNLPKIAFKKFIKPMTIFNALASISMIYVKESVNPNKKHTLDYVQYPRETLINKKGNCDDMNILFASALESVGIETIILITPAQALVAFDANIDPDIIESLAWDKSMTVLFKNKVWLPIQTNKINRSFIVAWKAGAKELQRWMPKALSKSDYRLPSGDNGGQVKVVHIKKAWNIYPAISLSESKNTAVLLNQKKTLNLIKNDIELFKKLK